MYYQNLLLKMRKCRQKRQAAASEMRPLDRVLTSLASLRVGRCTAVQLGRTCDTSACPQSGSPQRLHGDRHQAPMTHLHASTTGQHLAMVMVRAGSNTRD